MSVIVYCYCSFIQFDVSLTCHVPVWEYTLSTVCIATTRLILFLIVVEKIDCGRFAVCFLIHYNTISFNNTFTHIFHKSCCSKYANPANTNNACNGMTYIQAIDVRKCGAPGEQSVSGWAMGDFVQKGRPGSGLSLSVLGELVTFPRSCGLSGESSPRLFGFCRRLEKFCTPAVENRSPVLQVDDVAFV